MTACGGAARRGHFYPGTGAAGEVGAGAGEGFTVNVPWPCGGMGNGARACWRCRSQASGAFHSGIHVCTVQGCWWRSGSGTSACTPTAWAAGAHRPDGCIGG